MKYKMVVHLKMKEMWTLHLPLSWCLFSCVVCVLCSFPSPVTGRLWQRVWQAEMDPCTEAHLVSSPDPPGFKYLLKISLWFLPAQMAWLDAPDFSRAFLVCVLQRPLCVTLPPLSVVILIRLFITWNTFFGGYSSTNIYTSCPSCQLWQPKLSMDFIFWWNLAINTFKPFLSSTFFQKSHVLSCALMADDQRYPVTAMMEK